MDHVNILRKYGLFDAKVPRYTSYPPANRFEPNIGARMQTNWLAQVPANEPISVYVHIPFCRRLCWFCACRTQGTKTRQPVAAYVDDLVAEIDRAATVMTGRQQMARLHLGGGTPTLLDTTQMTRLLDALDQNFRRAQDFEFSVEIDPTEAAPEVLALLAERGLGRASIGVQDFDPKVQAAIGRQQSFEDTKSVVDLLRRLDIQSLNVDLLYGLPHQSLASLKATLQQVHSLSPDRLALYGYAHVPHVSKRQVMIPHDALPTTLQRFEAAMAARDWLETAGYVSIGIDHFALQSDSLVRAAISGQLKRNFQGYTDDPCQTLIGFGASAVSKFAQGYTQNAVATAAYQKRIRDGALSGQKGYEMSERDLVLMSLINQIMCKGCIDPTTLIGQHPRFSTSIQRTVDELLFAFPKALQMRDGQLRFKSGMEALARVVAARVDTELDVHCFHSSAI